MYFVLNIMLNWSVLSINVLINVMILSDLYIFIDYLFFVWLFILNYLLILVNKEF